MTPAYDLPSSHPYGDTTMALSINGRIREDLERAEFIALGGAVGLRTRAVERAMDELRERVDLWIGHLDTLPFDDRRGPRRSLRGLSRACMVSRHPNPFLWPSRECSTPSCGS